MHIHPARTLAASAALLPLLAQSAVHADVYGHRIVVVSGETVPGLGSATFTGFASPQLNAAGQVAFLANTSHMLVHNGLWTSVASDPGAVELLAGSNLSIPGGDVSVRYGEFHYSYHHPLLNDDGNVGFSARVVGLTPEPTTGLFRRVDGEVSAVALPGSPAPGLPGATYKTISNLPAFTGFDGLAFNAQIEGPGVTEANDQALFMNWFGGVQMIVREGNGAPGLPGTSFSLAFLMNPLVDDSGRMSFMARLEGSSAADWSVWTGFPGALELVARNGIVSPTGDSFDGGYGPSFFGAYPAASGMTFSHMVDDGGQLRRGYWHFDGTDMETVVVEGQLGPIGTYADVTGWGGASGGDSIATAFAARFTGAFGADRDSAVIRTAPGVFGPAAEVLAREGDPAYGYGAGVVFDDIDDGTTLIAVDSAGRAYFRSRVRGPGINGTNNVGCWSVDPDGTINLVLKQQQYLLVNGFWKQVTYFTFSAGSGAHGGRRGGANEHGDIALHVAFADETEAIVVAQLPPACPGDVNHDGSVDVADLLEVLGAWSETGPIGSGGDANRDGVTDISDLLMVLGNWGACA